jgi:hypothetical protein
VHPETIYDKELRKSLPLNPENKENEKQKVARDKLADEEDEFILGRKE